MALNGMNEVRFGTSLSLTGSQATEGRVVRDGYEFMINKINAHGGIPIGGERYRAGLVCYDDGGDPATAARLVETLVTEDRVALLLGPYGSTVTLAATEMAERQRVPMVQAHGAATSIFERGHRYTFATLTALDRYFGSILEMAAGLDPRPGRVALISVDAETPRLAIDVAAGRAGDLGIEIVYRESYRSEPEDLPSVLARVRDRAPDIVLVGGYTGDTIPLMRRAKEAGLRPKLFGLLLGPTLPGFKEKLGASADYLLEPIQWSRNMPWQDDVFGWTAAEFAELFEEEYGYEPDYHPPQSAAAVMVCYHALQRAGEVDPQKVRDALAATDIMTFYGPIRFDETGRNVAKSMAVVQIQDRRPVVVYPADVAEGELVYPRVPVSGFKPPA